MPESVATHAGYLHLLHLSTTTSRLGVCCGAPHTHVDLRCPRLLLHAVRQSSDVPTTAYYRNAGPAAPRAKLVATRLAAARGAIR
jgi:hypothetical protein